MWHIQPMTQIKNYVPKAEKPVVKTAFQYDGNVDAAEANFKTLGQNHLIFEKDEDTDTLTVRSGENIMGVTPKNDYWAIMSDNTLVPVTQTDLEANYDAVEQQEPAGPAV